MITLTVVSFAVVFILCVFGLFSARFRDNWLQAFGLVGVGFTSALATYKAAYMEWVPPEMAVFAMSVALFGVGTAVKVWQYRRHHPREELPDVIDKAV